MSKADDIKQHRRIELTTVNVLRRLRLTREECEDTGNMRRFCATNGKTLPEALEIVVEPRDDDKDYAWTVICYEQPNLPEEAPA
jgi:hypothetical protein